LVSLSHKCPTISLTVYFTASTCAASPHGGIGVTFADCKAALSVVSVLAPRRYHTLRQMVIALPRGVLPNQRLPLQRELSSNYSPFERAGTSDNLSASLTSGFFHLIRSVTPWRSIQHQLPRKANEQICLETRVGSRPGQKRQFLLSAEPSVARARWMGGSPASEVDFGNATMVHLSNAYRSPHQSSSATQTAVISSRVF
jgi:hypothetical protein